MSDHATADVSTGKKRKRQAPRTTVGRKLRRLYFARQKKLAEDIEKKDMAMGMIAQATTEATSNSRLFRLPVELREMILRYVLRVDDYPRRLCKLCPRVAAATAPSDKSEVAIWMKPKSNVLTHLCPLDKRRGPGVAFLYTCRQAYLEGIPQLYGNGHSFTFPDGGWRWVHFLQTKVPNIFLQTIGPLAKYSITSIGLHMQASSCERISFNNMKAEQLLWQLLRECRKLKRISIDLHTSQKHHSKNQKAIQCQFQGGTVDDLVSVLQQFWKTQVSLKSWDVPTQESFGVVSMTATHIQYRDWSKV